MQLGLTLPLQKHLKIKLPRLTTEKMPDLVFCWDLHLLRWEDKPGLIAVNASSRYAIFLHPMGDADWARLPGLVMEQIRRALSETTLPTEWVERYLQTAGAPELTGTHGRKSVAGLNQVVSHLFFFEINGKLGELGHPEIEYWLNQEPAHAAGFTGYGSPTEFLERDFARLFGEAGASEQV